MQVTPKMLIEATSSLIDNQVIMQAKLDALQTSNYILCFTTFILSVVIYKMYKSK